MSARESENKKIKLLIEDSLDMRRQAIVYSLARKFYNLMPSSESIKSDENNRWIEISSLSKLRASVGGRFNNLKKRWVDSGLPLRSHKGDREQGAVINKDAWLEMVNWINGQGFEALLGEQADNYLFKIKKMPE